MRALWIVGCRSAAFVHRCMGAWPHWDFTFVLPLIGWVGLLFRSGIGCAGRLGEPLLVWNNFATFAGEFNQNWKAMSDIASRVKAIIVDKLGVDENEVTAEASFTNDLGADSLDTVELIMEFEKEFDIQIPDDQAERIATVGQAISYIEKILNK